jgi:hypothetical protein
MKARVLCPPQRQKQEMKPAKINDICVCRFLVIPINKLEGMGKFERIVHENVHESTGRFQSISE